MNRITNLELEPLIRYDVQLQQMILILIVSFWSCFSLGPASLIELMLDFLTSSYR